MILMFAVLFPQRRQIIDAKILHHTKPGAQETPLPKGLPAMRMQHIAKPLFAISDQVKHSTSPEYGETFSPT